MVHDLEVRLGIQATEVDARQLIQLYKARPGQGYADNAAELHHLAAVASVQASLAETRVIHAGAKRQFLDLLPVNCKLALLQQDAIAKDRDAILTLKQFGALAETWERYFKQKSIKTQLKA